MSEKPSPTYLDVESDLWENKLRFVENEMESEMKSILKDDLTSVGKEPRTKIVQPEPGFCLKAFNTLDNEKAFVNICRCADIPPPMDISAEKLRHLLSTDEPSSYRVPMSITELRKTADKKGKKVPVCDVAVHPTFLLKVRTEQLFQDFFVTLIIEALDTKYGLQLNPDNWIILQNRTHMGVLEKHRIQDRDLKTVAEYYGNDPISGRKLIEELTGSVKKSPKIEQIDDDVRKPQYRIVREQFSNCIVGEFYMPEVVNFQEIQFDCNDDRIVINVPKRGYYLDGFLNYKLIADCADAQFDRLRGVRSCLVNIRKNGIR